jgi:malonyl-CoA O-methyltransferase
MMTRVAQEFSRFAKSYGKHNIIQANVAETLISKLPREPIGRLLDLGCGNGELYRRLRARGIAFDHLTVVDISPEMLRLHPEEACIHKVEGNFDHAKGLEHLPYSHYDVVLSASALQWSRDLDRTLSLLTPLSECFYFAIFTSGTFATLHHTAGVTSPIRSESELIETISRHIDAAFETVHYTLAFDSVYRMLRYIKESGTSGGERQLSYSETKRLLESYPLDHLEFEVLFVTPKGNFLS